MGGMPLSPQGRGMYWRDMLRPAVRSMPLPAPFITHHSSLIILLASPLPTSRLCAEFSSRLSAEFSPRLALLSRSRLFQLLALACRHFPVAAGVTSCRAISLPQNAIPNLASSPPQSQGKSLPIRKMKQGRKCHAPHCVAARMEALEGDSWRRLHTLRGRKCHAPHFLFWGGMDHSMPPKPSRHGP